MADTSARVPEQRSGAVIPRPTGKVAGRLQRRIEALECLTLGDFAAIARGNALLDEETDEAASPVERLEADHALKPDAGNRPWLADLTTTSCAGDRAEVTCR